MMADGLEFGGVERFASDASRLFQALTDLDQLTASIPDLVSAERLSDNQLRCVVRPGFSFLRGTLKLAIELTDRTPCERASLDVQAAGIGQSLRIASQLSLVPLESGSELTWQAAATERKGLVAAVSPALLRGAAEQVIRHAWEQLRQRLGEA